MAECGCGGRRGYMEDLAGDTPFIHEGLQVDGVQRPKQLALRFEQLVAVLVISQFTAVPISWGRALPCWSQLE
jgi:hypothetical protein